MTDNDQKEEVKPLSQAIEEQKNDTSWKKEPYIKPDGYLYRVNRVQLKDGSYKVFEVRVGKKPFGKGK